MARPITWDEVAAPSFGAPLAASAAAARQVTDALAGLSNTAAGYAGAVKEEATREAVANIMNAADPVAAARATEQSWKIDPLEVQKAVAGQELRNQQSLAAAASLEASRTTTERNRAELEDRTAVRQASTMSSPMIDEIVQKGKLPSIDLNKDEWKSAAGNMAYKQVLDFWNNYQDDKRQAETLWLQRKTALNAENEKDFLGFAREFGASPAGQKADPATWDRTLTDEAKRRGVSVALVDQGLQFAERGAQSNRPTDTELGRNVTNFGEGTYRDINSGLSIRAKDLEQQKAAALSKYDRANRGQELAAGNVFSGPVSGVPAKLATALDWSEEDAKEAIDAIKAEYKNLTDWQAADIALDTKGKWFEGKAARSDEAKAKAGAYQAFNEIGGKEGLARKLTEAASPFDKELARLPVLQRQVIGAAREGSDVPREAVNITKTYKEAAAREKKAAEKVEADAAAAAAKALKEAEEERVRQSAIAPFIGRPSYMTGR